MNHILVVDDKPENRYLLRALLEGHGFSVDEARHGAEALTLAHKILPQLVISDLLMPVMDGYTLLREWKADEQLRSIPFVVYTATYTEPRDERLALSMGADDFILKPTEPELLMARIHAVLTAKRSGQLVFKKPSGDETAVLRQYNETLIRKLEEKMLQLQQANQALTEDIRLRTSAEDALRAQKEFLDAVIANEPECVKVINPQGRLEQMNPAGLAMLEVPTLAEAQKSSLLDFLPADQPEHRAAFISFLQQICNGASGTLVYPIIGQRGTRRWVESHAAPLRDERRGITVMLSITRDITERLRLEEELRQAHKMEIIGRLAGGIAHDFNNQLTVILGFGALMLSHASDERAKKYAAHIMNAAERSADLVRQVLTFSRKSRAEFKPVDLHVLIDETIAVLEHSVAKKIRLVRDLTAADAQVMGDASLLQNAMLNLALNARDALPDGGEIRFSTAIIAMEDLDAALRARLNADAKLTSCLRISVSDTGHGMSAEILPRIFEPFFSTKDPGLGTGLGLASVQSTVRQHGGDIAVHSAPGQGTTFQFHLPCLAAGPTVAVRQSSVHAPGPSTARRCVMVIDDEALVSAFVVDALTARGYQVIAKTDPFEAAAHYRQHWHTIDLVILDLNMPTMSGADVFAAIRAVNPQARIMLASGFSDEASIADLLCQGACDFLPKPFSPDELVQRVACNLR